MDEMEMKEELEQETVTEEIEEAVEETAEAAEVEEEAAAEEAEEATEEVPVEKVAEKESRGIIGIVVGVAMLIAVMAIVWMAPVGSKPVQDKGVFYAKDNGLYFYDMKNEPYLVQEGISDGGGYNYFYSAWGAAVAEEGDWAYYSVNIKEDGSSDLCRKNVKDPSAETVLVDSEVYDYTVSKDGNVVAYLKMQGESLHLCTFDGGSITTYAKGIHLEDDVYKLSDNGKYLVFKDAYDMLCAAEVITGGGEVDVAVLTDSCPLYELSEDGTLYFVSKADGIFNIYSYDFENEPELVAENAQYMELMPNGKDLLYGVKPTEIIPYSELLEDDMAEIDAAMKEDDPNYEQKLMRDTLREAMASGEGLEPLMQEFYIFSGGKATLVADNVISAVAVADSDRNFVTGYQAKPFQPLYLSVIGGGLEMVDMIYYMSLNYGGMQPFLADGNGNVEILAGSGVLPNTVKVSSDGSKAAYLATDETTGGNVLMEMKVGKAAEAAAVQVNVEDFAFIGGNGPLCYYYGYANGTGTLASVDSDRTITDVTGVQFAEDVKEVYYIAGIDGSTGNGQMQHWNGKDEPTIVDGGIFAFQYKGNGKAAILYQYDVMSQMGDLGYYDGKGVTMLDEDITAIFMY